MPVRDKFILQDSLLELEELTLNPTHSPNIWVISRWRAESSYKVGSRSSIVAGPF